MSIEQETALLALVPLVGTKGNVSLTRELGWEPNLYWEVRDRLVDKGELELGRGKGGSVRRPTKIVAATPPETSPEGTNQTTAEDAQQPVDAQLREADLYLPISVVLENQWVRDKRFESFLVHITAQQGRRSTGGRWTRPDITIAAFSTYSYVPGRHFDVVTFEVKTHDAIDVTAVYEALAHLRSATKAYVVLHVPPEVGDSMSDAIAEVQSEAKKHGVGLLIVGKLDDYETWDELVEARRFEPEPHRLNDFLATQLTKEQLEKLVRWFR